MPNKYVHFTEEQKQAAKQTDLAAFLESRGEKLKRSGSEYEWVGHHITIRGNQFFHVRYIHRNAAFLRRMVISHISARVATQT